VFNFNVVVPPILKKKVEGFWTSIGISTVATLVGSRCPTCLEFSWVGERHHNCKSPVPTENLCVYCLKDERYGDHSDCQIQIIKIRNQVISVFRNSQEL